tara:strand:+ start:8504 stop:10078 length:1575 start_codon:yes stop_codon:yes gene_type:complete
MSVVLRGYQQEAVNKTRMSLSKYDRALIVAGTGSGKSIVNAELIYLASKKSKRVLQLVHTKELVKQNSDCFNRLFLSRGDDINYSICCAGISSPCLEYDIVFASPQTFVNNMDNIKDFDLIIIDEADKIPLHEASIYQTILSKFQCKVIGMTATPYRENNTPIFGKGGFFDTISYRISAKKLTEMGYLTPYQPINYISEKVDIDTDKIKLKTNGSYDEASHEKAFKDFYVETSNFTLKNTINHNKVLIFCTSIDHAEKVALCMNTTYVIHSKLSKKERDDMLFDFKHDRNVKYMINVSILTIGFDCPQIDCVVLMRAVQSIPLFLQIIGRAQRLSKDKEFFNVIDFGENIKRHGGVYDDDVFNSMEDNKSHITKKEITKEISVNSEAKDKNCVDCLAIIEHSDIQCWACKSLIKKNLSYMDTSEPLKDEEIKYTTYKFTKNKSGLPMCIITFKTLPNNSSVNYFLTLSGRAYKVKSDKKFIYKYFGYYPKSFNDFYNKYKTHNHHKRIKYFKNASGYHEIVKLC